MFLLQQLEVDLTDFGPRDLGYTWAEVKMVFWDTDRQGHPALKVTVPVQCDEARLVSASRGEALDQTKDLLVEALRLLEEADLSSLRAIAEKNQAAEEADIMAETNASLDETLGKLGQ